jgi:SAM-dependent methyltransferase
VTDYDRHGHGYAHRRRTDPRIAAQINAALGSARTIVNVGAGTGSYEPPDRYVLAVEPSATMRAQRPSDRVPAIDARAEALPLDDDSVDAAMALSTIHHWSDPIEGLRELRRVARGPVLVLTFDIDAFSHHWLVADYAPEMVDVERRRMPTVSEVADTLGSARVESIALAHDCEDGFIEAFYGRPEALLEEGVRQAQSAWRQLPAGVEERIVRTLADDLDHGRWDERHGQLRELREYGSSLRLVVSAGS